MLTNQLSWSFVLGFTADLKHPHAGYTKPFFPNANIAVSSSCFNFVIHMVVNKFLCDSSTVAKWRKIIQLARQNGLAKGKEM